jgi:hypothetical protein
MKATLATLACLLTVGFLSAAEVTGNNTAVVIRKNVVESDTGYQFLCVPVDGLDIANGATKAVKLSTVLPPSTLTAGTQIIFVGGDLAKVGTTFSVTEGANGKEWSNGGGEAELPGGQIFWLKYQAPVVSSSATRRGASVVTYAPQTTSNDTVIFCGQDRALSKWKLGNGITAMANDSSVAVALKDLPLLDAQGQSIVPSDLDTILVIQSGSSDYKQYNYFGGVWYGPNGVPSNTDTIAPGEAFYYFKRSN